MITEQEAFEKGYLQKKTVFLKPVPRGGKLINNPAHIAYFQVEGASNWFQLPQTERGALVNPFSSDAEREYFEYILDTELSVHKKKNNFWHTFFVKVVKDYNLMHDGYKFNLADPLDNLRYRVTKLQSMVAPSWEERLNSGEYRFALVDEGYEEEKEMTTTNKLMDAYMLFGEMKNSIPKMASTLGVYFLEKNEMKFVPEDASKEFLHKELNRIVQNETDLFLKIVNDPQSKIKNLINNGIRTGAILKEARNKYTLVGENVSYTYIELVQYLTKAEETKADVYLKLVAQVKNLK